MRRWGALGVGCVAAAALAWTGRVPEAGAGWRLAFAAIHLLSFAGLIAWLRTCAPSTRLIWVGAVLFRIIAFPMLPALSDDGYRYLWDGRITIETRASPYQYRPSDPTLDLLRPSVEYQGMNSTEYYSVYPPASQAAFALAVAFGGESDWRRAWWAWKALLVLCELGAVWVLLRFVRPRAAALYAWSPLAVIEVAGQGHTEALVLAGLAVTMVVSRARWPLRSIGLTLAGGVKIYPLVWLPQAWRREGFVGVLASVALAVAASVPVWHASAFAHVSESVGLFFGQFDEYAAPYLILKSLAYPLLEDAAGATASRALGVAFATAVGVWFLADDGTDRTWRRLLAIGVLAFTLTASTLHPWYWLPVLFLSPFLPPSRALLWLVAWASFGYVGYTIPGASLVATIIGWGGAAVLLWLDGRQRRLGHHATRSAAVAEVASTQRASG